MDDTIVVDDKQMKSNLQIYIKELDRMVDLLHVFMVFVVHIYCGLKKEDEKKDDKKKIKLDNANIKVSVPINALECHTNFMLSCFRYVFGDCVDITTEPEAAFSYISAKSEKQDELEKHQHIILADGGDGTFDYLYVKRFDNIWSKQHSQAFNCAGTKMFYNFRDVLENIFT